MIQPILTHSIAIILLAISILHIYWLLGGKWGFEAATPGDMTPIFADKRKKTIFTFATFCVAIGLFIMASIIYSNYNNVWNNYLDTNKIILATRIIGTIFILRAIGDFNVCGIFKKSKDTLFTRCDNKIYIPLCLFLGLGSWMISLL